MAGQNVSAEGGLGIISLLCPPHETDDGTMEIDAGSPRFVTQLARTRAVLDRTSNSPHPGAIEGTKSSGESTNPNERKWLFEKVEEIRQEWVQAIPELDLSTGCQS